MDQSLHTTHLWQAVCLHVANLWRAPSVLQNHEAKPGRLQKGKLPFPAYLHLLLRGLCAD